MVRHREPKQGAILSLGVDLAEEMIDRWSAQTDTVLGTLQSTPPTAKEEKEARRGECTEGK